VTIAFALSASRIYVNLGRGQMQRRLVHPCEFGSLLLTVWILVKHPGIQRNAARRSEALVRRIAD
jgi:hypothetical protein